MRWQEGGPAPYVSNEGLRYMLIGYARVSKADGPQSLCGTVKLTGIHSFSTRNQF